MSSWPSSPTRTGRATRTCSSCLKAATRCASIVESKVAQPLAGWLSGGLFRSCTRLPRAQASLRLSAGWAVPAGHVGLVCDTGVAAQAARHRLRGGATWSGRGGRLPGRGIERGEVRADTAGRRPDRGERIQGISLVQPPVCLPIHPCTHPCTHPSYTATSPIHCVHLLP
jgi:hypothetical protein